MLIRIKYLFKGIINLLWLPIIISCSQAGAYSSPQTDAGNLVLSNNNSTTDVVLGGTHQYTLSIANMQNLKTPIAITISNSNKNVATIESNTCINPIDPSSYDLIKNSCSFYIRGNAIGDTILTIKTDNYPIITQPLSITQEWGTFGGEARFQDGTSGFVSDLSFNGDEVYFYVNPYGDVFASHGNSLREIGGGSTKSDNTGTSLPLLVSDVTHVCATTLNEPDGKWYLGITCSTNGASWKDLPDINQGALDNSRWLIEHMSLFNGNLYVVAVSAKFGQEVFYCNVDNCINWQFNQPFNIGTGVGTIFESNVYAAGYTEIDYQMSDGSWQNFGSYHKNRESGEQDFIEANENGVVIASVIDSEKMNNPTYTQRIYYNSTSNIGGNFSKIGEITKINSLSSYPCIAMDKNTIYIGAGDGNVYFATKLSNEEWTPFTRVGQNNPWVNKIYLHNNKLYALGYQDSRIYVYSLSK